MKTKTFSMLAALAIGLSAGTVLGQTAPATRTTPNNAIGANNLTFSNRVGQVYTVQQLATQLRNLRNVVDQTLPMLTAFNQNFAGSAAAQGSQNLAGRLEGIVSGALSRNNSSSPVVSNLVSSLRGVLGSNTINPNAATDAKTLADLATLQTDMQPLPNLLQNLNIAGSATPPNPSQVISSPPTAGYTTPPTNTPGAPPTPTGRQ